MNDIHVLFTHTVHGDLNYMTECSVSLLFFFCLFCFKIRFQIHLITWPWFHVKQTALFCRSLPYARQISISFQKESDEWRPIVDATNNVTCSHIYCVTTVQMEYCRGRTSIVTGLTLGWYISQTYIIAVSSNVAIHSTRSTFLIEIQCEDVCTGVLACELSCRFAVMTPYVSCYACRKLDGSRWALCRIKVAAEYCKCWLVICKESHYMI